MLSTNYVKECQAEVIKLIKSILRFRRYDDTNNFPQRCLNSILTTHSWTCLNIIKTGIMPKLHIGYLIVQIV